MIEQLNLKAYGKINLGLDVLRKREDGYHEVRMIMQTVGLYDRIDLKRKKEPGISVSTNLYYLPTNENNLAYRAAHLLMEPNGVKEGIEIRIKKMIPVAAGMAGGSSDAAAVLWGVNRMFGLGFSVKELMEQGVKLGADVPYCIMRGTVLSEGIGEKLTSLPPVPQCQVLLVKPPISVSTRTVYQNLQLKELSPEEHPDIDRMIRAIREKNLDAITACMGNVLETVTERDYPVIGKIKNLMKEYGADNALMSGSGPTVFGLFQNSKAAEEACEIFRQGEGKEMAKQVFLTRFYHSNTAQWKKEGK